MAKIKTGDDIIRYVSKINQAIQVQIANLQSQISNPIKSYTTYALLAATAPTVPTLGYAVDTDTYYKWSTVSSTWSPL